jgi:GntR family transcriptional regulator
MPDPRDSSGSTAPRASAGAPNIGLHVGRVYSVLADEIAAGAREPGERLPPERGLARDFGASRTTIRRALAALAADGLIESQPGRGTFVAGGRVAEPPNLLMSFTELGRSFGLTPTARVLSKAVRDATFEEARDFQIAPGTPLFHLERLRMLDGQPTAIDATTVPLMLAPGLVDIDFTTGSVYEGLAENGHDPFRAHYVVEAITADERTAELLDAPVGSALLVARTRGYEVDGRLVEVGRTTYRGDRYQFEATLRRRRQPWSAHETDSPAPKPTS